MASQWTGEQWGALEDPRVHLIPKGVYGTKGEVKNPRVQMGGTGISHWVFASDWWPALFSLSALVKL